VTSALPPSASAQQAAIAALSKFSRAQINSAGARYTPGVDPAAPNIENEALFRALAHLTCGPEVVAAFATIRKELGDRWNRSRRACEEAGRLDELVRNLCEPLPISAERLRGGDEQIYTTFIANMKALARDLGAVESALHQQESEALERSRQKAAAAGTQGGDYSTEANEIRGRIVEIRNTTSYLADLLEIYEGAPGQALVRRLALLRGRWGTGKTHFLCDLAAQRLRDKRPVLLLLAKNFQSTRNVLDTVARTTGIADSIESLVDKLDKLGLRVRERVLILVDGVNEGPRGAWHAALDELARLVEQKLNVSFLVSCRTPFENIAISSVLRERLIVLDHTGFADHEFDAQAEFFRYYEIPLPEVPLLNDEFSRPLTLKLICESLRGLSKGRTKKGFYGIASGQKGMTFVLETFVNRIGISIESAFGLPSKSCWLLLKGIDGAANRRISGFAPYMAAALREYVGRRAALQIIAAQHPRLSPLKRRQLLDALRVNGLLDEDLVWTGRIGTTPRSRIVYRLPYQRFSDHLIARHLLDTYLDKTDRATVLASFRGTRPLGRVFSIRRQWRGYTRPGWAEALIVEFPESAKRVIATKERELFFFLSPRAEDLNHYYEPFLNGLFWRSPSAFSRGTDRIVDALLKAKNDRVWQRTVDALVAVSIKDAHPYSASQLYKYLAHFEMRERDLLWTEYARKNDASPSIDRLLTWMGRVDDARVAPTTAKKLMTLLSLVLTTVARGDRDVATRALVVLGERHPDQLFKHTITTLAFNDPYVPERMLAASYGVAMSQWAVPNQSRFRRDLISLAKELYRLMFAPGAPHATHHALRRDYALGLIRLALRVDRKTLSRNECKYLEAPFAHIPSVFPPAVNIPDEECGDGDSAIHMDFGNYTMGRLVRGRANYDDKNPTYREIRRQIEWRIGDLGYRKKDFEAIDRELGSSGFYAEERRVPKRDRYGKKYSWISFFEMYGLREAQELLEEYRAYERTSDSDIDPSFPKEPPSWTPPVPDISVEPELSPEEWLSRGLTPDFVPLIRLKEINGEPGPWVLLAGFVQREEPTLNRELFAFLRGLLLRPADISKLRGRFLRIEYPGNFVIPNIPEDHYLFAGEAGTSARYAPELLRRDGTYRRQMEEAFGRTEALPATESKRKDVLVINLANGGRAPGDPAGGGDRPEGDTGKKIRISRPRPGGFRKIPGVRVEIPSRRFSWESYHSAMNKVSGFMLPAPSLIQVLDLRTWNREIDFRDAEGKYATLYREGGGGWRGNRHDLLYLREDLLRKYLSKVRQVLVWCNWGERDWMKKGESDHHFYPERITILQKHLNIHRRFVAYKDLPDPA
jgi:hypothetical protein